ncbi:SDR family oxidoreductase [Mycobacteroides abscessus]
MTPIPAITSDCAFKGYVVFITGGGRGLGATIARHFARRGAHVIINYFHSREKADQLATELLGAGYSCETIWGSVASDAHVKRMFGTLSQTHTAVDVLINNAAGGIFSRVEDTESEYLERAIETNFRGALRCSLAAMPLMRHSPHPSIINITSSGAAYAIDGYGTVGATKAATEGLGRSLALEFSPYGIRVNNVRFGIIETDIFEKIVQPEKVHEDLANLIGRPIDPEEAASVIAFLASPAAAAITGATVVADGGESVFLPAKLVSKLPGELINRNADLQQEKGFSPPQASADHDTTELQTHGPRESVNEPIAIVGIGGVLAGCDDPSAIWSSLIQGSPQFNTPERVDCTLYDWHFGRYPQQGAFVGNFRYHHTLQSEIDEGTWDSEADIGVTLMRNTILQALDGVRRPDNARWFCSVEYSGEMTWSQLQRPMTGAAYSRWLNNQALDDTLAAHYGYREIDFASSLPPLNIRLALSGLVPLDTPVVASDAACSSSIAAVRTAVTALRSCETDIVICTGATVIGAVESVLFKAAGGISRKGHVAPFDDSADGTLLGEGSVSLIMKRLSDARSDGDTVHAVILGVGESADGKRASIHAPSSDGQAQAIRRAWEAADLDPAKADWVVAHGTGTRVGDRVELEALAKVFAGGQRFISSAKATFGHTSGLAGLVNILTACLAFTHEAIPPQPGFAKRAAGLADTLKVPLEPIPWLHRPHEPRLAGVSSAGLGGVNGHIVLGSGSIQSPKLKPPATPLDDVVIVGYTTNFPGADELQVHDWLDGGASVPDRSFGERYPLPKNPPLRIPPVTLAEMDRTQVMAVQCASQLLSQLGEAPSALASTTSVYTATAPWAGRTAECAHHIYAQDVRKVLSTKEQLFATTIEDTIGINLSTIVQPGADSFTGSMPGLPGARIANYFGFNEDCRAVYNITDACFTSFHLARQQLSLGNSDLALIWVCDGSATPEWQDALREFNPADHALGEGGVLFALMRYETANKFRLPILGHVQTRLPSATAPDGRVPPMSNSTPAAISASGRFYPETGTALAIIKNLNDKRPVVLHPHHPGTPELELKFPQASAQTAQPAADIGRPMRVDFVHAAPLSEEPKTSQYPSTDSTLLLCGTALLPDVSQLAANWGLHNCHDITVFSAEEVGTPEHVFVFVDPSDDTAFVHEYVYRVVARCRPKSVAVLLVEAVHDDVPEPGVGLFSGLLRSLAVDLPDSRVVAVATSDGLDEHSLKLLLAELAAAPSLSTVCYDHGNRLVLKLSEAQPQSGVLPINSDSVIVSVGGGRGITREILKALAVRTHATIHILGRTVLSETEPAPPPCRERYIKEHLSAHRSMKETLKSYESLLRSAEVYKTVSELRSISGPSKVHYHACDILDADQVAATLKHIPQATLLLNAATEMAPASLDLKSFTQFCTVRDVKMKGYINLKAALSQSPPRMWCNFSTLGTLVPVGGDSDYLSGCEYLCEASRYSHRQGSDEFSILWGGWSETGLAAEESFKKNITSRLHWTEWVTSEQGVSQFFEALTNYRHVPVLTFLRQEDLLDHLLKELSAERPDDRVHHSGSTEISLEKYPWLQDHRVKGQPVIPGLFAFELAASAASQLYPTLKIVGAKNLRCIRPIYLRKSPIVTTIYSEATLIAENFHSKTVNVTLSADLIAPDGTVLREDLIRYETDIILEDSYAFLKSPPNTPMGPGLPNLTHSLNGVVDLTGPFAATSDHRVAGSTSSARWKIAREDLDNSLSDMKTPFLLLDAMCQVGFLPGPDASLISIGYLKNIDKIDIFTSQNDMELSQSGVVIRMQEDGDRVAQVDGRIIARLRGVRAEEIAQLPVQALIDSNSGR